MTDVSVRGIYRDGVIELSEKVAASNGQSVIVIFPELFPKKDTESYREQLQSSIARWDPEFLEMTESERQLEFERISEKIADSLPFQTPEEFIRAMRREDFDSS